MKRSLIQAVVCALAILPFAFGMMSSVQAKPEFAAKEKVACPTCHDMSQFPKRNPIGECYKRHGFKDLAACQKDPKK